MNLIRPFRVLMIILFTMVSGLILTLTFWLPNRRIYYFVSHRFWGPGLLWSVGAKVQVEGLENLPGSDSCICYANHRSYFDIPALMKGIPIPLYFIAKVELKRVPFLGWAMQAVGMIFVDRKNSDRSRESMHKAGESVRSGKSIAAFPEGTRSETMDLLPFKKGVIAMAKQERITLVPVAISGSEKILPRRGSLDKGTIKLIIGQPIQPEEMESRSVRELSEYARERLAGILFTPEQKSRRKKSETD